MISTDTCLVLVTFNRSDLLIEMLTSVIEATRIPAEIFVIDNNSSDNTEEKVHAFAESQNSDSKITYHNTGANLGGAGGFEYGTKTAFEAGYDWVWLADDDVAVAKNCLEVLSSYKGKASILQPMRINPDNSCTEVSSTKYQLNNPFKLNPKGKPITEKSEQGWESMELATIPFEGPLIHRSVFETIGFPNKDFFIFMDDLDFALRAQAHGFKILCVKNAHMIRKLPFSQTQNLLSWKGYFMYRNFFYIQLNHAPKTVALIRNTAILITASGYYALTGKFRAVPMLLQAYKDASNNGLKLTSKYLP